jgi:hypothetical protein
MTYCVEFFYAKAGKIPSRQPFQKENLSHNVLYLVDFRSVVIGDLIGLSFVDFGFGMTIPDSIPSVSIILTALVIAFLSALMAHALWLSLNRQHSSSYPRPGKVTLVGILHLVYYFIQFTVVVLAIHFLIIGNVLMPKLIILIGGVIYGIAFLDDTLSGRYASKKGG